MSKFNQLPVSVARVWTAPRLQRIGTIAEVAANGTTITQGSGNSKS